MGDHRKTLIQNQQYLEYLGENLQMSYYFKVYTLKKIKTNKRDNLK